MKFRATTTCSRCVQDNVDPDIDFDHEGVCNYCRKFAPKVAALRLSDDESKRRLGAIAERIKAEGRGRPYDCLVGVSGGVDSSYVAYLASQLGLRALLVHFDNGWNSETAVENIRRLMDASGFELRTNVIDWEEFRDLQRAFFQASVVDVELLTDHAITAATFDIARKNRIRYVLSGANINTEHGLPPSWSWLKQDWTNIRAIHRKFGARRLKHFPRTSVWTWAVNKLSNDVRFVRLLNVANYRKLEAMRTLSREVGWKYYGGKHYESVFTKFYQAHYLPEKFGIDKRKAHLSALIRNGELTRDEAVQELTVPLYGAEELRIEREYCLKKLGFNEAEWEEIMARPPKAHSDYPSDARLVRRMLAIKAALTSRRVGPSVQLDQTMIAAGPTTKPGGAGTSG